METGNVEERIGWHHHQRNTKTWQTKLPARYHQTKHHQRNKTKPPKQSKPWLRHRNGRPMHHKQHQYRTKRTKKGQDITKQDWEQQTHQTRYDRSVSSTVFLSRKLLFRLPFVRPECKFFTRLFVWTFVACYIDKEHTWWHWVGNKSLHTFVWGLLSDPYSPLQILRRKILLKHSIET